VRAVLTEHGALTINDLGGAKGSGWERSLANKWARECLLATGEVACVRRHQRQRVYQLTESALPRDLRERSPGSEECMAQLSGVALRAAVLQAERDINLYPAAGA